MRLIFIVGCLGMFGCSGLKIEGTKDQGPYRIEWAKNLDPSYQTGNLPVGLSSPLLFEGLVFMGGPKGSMTAYNADNGRVIWQERDNFEQSAKPVPFKDQVIFGTTQGRVFSRDRVTGKLKYAVDLNSTIESPGVIADGRILFHSRNHTISCLDAETGKILWAYRRSVPFLTTIQRVSEPTVVDGKVIVGLADGYVMALRLEDGAVIWESKVNSGKKFVDVDTRPLVLGDRIAMTSMSGEMVLIEQANGVIVGRFPYRALRAPIKVSDGFLLTTVDGEVLKLNPQFEIIAKQKLADRALGSMDLLGDKVVVSAPKGKMYILNPDLSKKALFQYGGSVSTIFGDFSSEGDRLSFLSSRNRLYVLDINKH